MSEQPTPETDAAIKDQSKWMRPFVSTTFNGITYDYPVASLCRKLERERDEARDELRDIRLNLGEDAKGYTLADAVILLQNARNDHRAVDVEWREHNER